MDQTRLAVCPPGGCVRKEWMTGGARACVGVSEQADGGGWGCMLLPS